MRFRMIQKKSRLKRGKVQDPGKLATRPSVLTRWRAGPMTVIDQNHASSGRVGCGVADTLPRLAGDG
jgi:hypothetical protein